LPTFAPTSSDCRLLCINLEGTALPPTLKTRKPIDQLTAKDLDAYPIWEFATDEENIPGRDETWVRPVDARSVRKGMWSLSVAADFKTASGREVPGFVTVTTAHGVEITPGVLLPAGGYLPVHLTKKSLRAPLARSLGLTVQQAFPLAYRLRVTIGREKEHRFGTIA
jgi:hypothetical protein